jgi:hypothetical protein
VEKETQLPAAACDCRAAALLPRDLAPFTLCMHESGNAAAPPEPKFFFYFRFVFRAEEAVVVNCRSVR